MQDGAEVVAGRLDGCLAGRMEQRIVNGSAQDEAEPKPVLALASSLLAGRIKSFIFEAL